MNINKYIYILASLLAIVVFILNITTNFVPSNTALYLYIFLWGTILYNK
jgi:hypothetical protein